MRTEGTPGRAETEEGAYELSSRQLKENVKIAVHLAIILKTNYSLLERERNRPLQACPKISRSSWIGSMPERCESLSRALLHSQLLRCGYPAAASLCPDATASGGRGQRYVARQES